MARDCCRNERLSHSNVVAQNSATELVERLVQSGDCFDLMWLQRDTSD